MITSRLRRLLAVAILAGALTAAVVGAGSAAELSTAEIGAMPNDVTVAQGGTASFEIWVGATGLLNCGITQGNPSTASLPTTFSITIGGQTSVATPSTPMAFFAGPPSGAACSTRWTGFPGSFRIQASVTAAEGAPMGDYLFTLSQAAGTVVVTNPAGLTPGLADAIPTGIRVHVTQAADTVAPVLDLPDDITAEATGPDGAVVSFSAIAVDAVDGLVPVFCDPPSGATFPLGTTAVACSAQDAAGNEATGSFDVSVVDTTPPALTLPSDITAEATVPAGAAVAFTATASDTVDGDVAASCDPASGTTFPLGSTTVDCAATDATGNSAEGSFTVTVVDTTGPVLTLPSDITVDAKSAGQAVVTYTASANDAVDGAVPVDCVPASGSTFNAGATTVGCEAEDSRGNASNGRFTVSVLTNGQAPILVLPGDIKAEATGPKGAMVVYSVTASDPQDGKITPSCSPASGSTFPLDQTTQVNCKATDSSGNTTTGAFAVTVVDSTAPVLKLPRDIKTGPNSPRGAWVLILTGGKDTVDGSVSVRCGRLAWSRFPFGTTTVSCSATDRHGNVAKGSFQVTVTGFKFKGFYSPVSNPPAVNLVKGNSIVPLRWTLSGESGIPIDGEAAIAQGWPKTTQMACPGAGKTRAAAAATAGGWWPGIATYYWRAPKTPNTCWQVEFRFNDGSTQVAYFRIK